MRAPRLEVFSHVKADLMHVCTFWVYEFTGYGENVLAYS